MSLDNQLYLELKDGRVVTGLKRRVIDESIVFATVDGKETTLQKNQIKLQRKLPLSIMPTGFGQSIPKGEFSNLIEYLLSQR